jgi:DNA topoisomerase IB
MDNPKKFKTLGTQDTERRQTLKKIQYRKLKKMSITDLHQKTGVKLLMKHPPCYSRITFKWWTNLSGITFLPRNCPWQGLQYCVSHQQVDQSLNQVLHSYLVIFPDKVYNIVWVTSKSQDTERRQTLKKIQYRKIKKMSITDLHQKTGVKLLMKHPPWQ